MKTKNIHHLASGLTYSDIEPLVESIARSKARQYKHIAYYDVEDIKQEVRLKCFTTLQNYDPERAGSNIRIFFTICADNRLKDIKRNVIYKHTSPCAHCDWFKNEKCRQFHDTRDCEKCARHERYVMTKLSVNSPVSIEEKRVVDSRSNAFIDNVDMIDYIFSLIPSGMTSLFIEFKERNFNLSAMPVKDRGTIMLTLKDIFYPEEW